MQSTHEIELLQVVSSFWCSYAKLKIKQIEKLV